MTVGEPVSNIDRELRGQDATAQITAAILKVVEEVPDARRRKSKNPAEASRRCAMLSAPLAASAAGTLGLPSGPVGWLAILPDMVAVWKIQARMVADIAAYYGKKDALNREQMLYCLFKHLASHAMSDLVIGHARRVTFKRIPLTVLRGVAGRAVVKITQRTSAKGVSRWLPAAGALGAAIYAYYDTAQVAEVAMDLFENYVDVGPPEPSAASRS